jgi:hypothetical protein
MKIEMEMDFNPRRRVALSVGLPRAEAKVTSLRRKVAIAESIAAREPWWREDSRQRVRQLRADLKLWLDAVAELHAASTQ